MNTKNEAKTCKLGKNENRSFNSVQPNHFPFDMNYTA